jgi:hypothetical protein
VPELVPGLVPELVPGLLSAPAAAPKAEPSGLRITKLCSAKAKLSGWPRRKAMNLVV